MSNAVSTPYVTREAYHRHARAALGKFERVDGQIVAMAPERASHNKRKMAAWLALRTAIQNAKLPCEAYGDGMSIAVGEDHDYEPDAVVRRGDKLPGDAVAIPNPLVIVEVLSPSTARTDMFRKLVDYFRLPSVQHYLILASERPEVIHYRREGSGTRQMVHTAGAIDLDPPGISLSVEAIYAD
jgi:Uma2 family endonuclease